MLSGDHVQALRNSSYLLSFLARALARVRGRESENQSKLRFPSVMIGFWRDPQGPRNARTQFVVDCIDEEPQNSANSKRFN